MWLKHQIRLVLLGAKRSTTRLSHFDASIEYHKRKFIPFSLVFPIKCFAPSLLRGPPSSCGCERDKEGYKWITYLFSLSLSLSLSLSRTHTQICVDDNNLQGFIPEELFNALSSSSSPSGGGSSSTSLQITRNPKLIGSIPKSISRMTKLTSLDLSENGNKKIPGRYGRGFLRIN